MKRNWVYLVLFSLIISSMHIVSCTNMGMLFDSKSGIIKQIKQEAVEREESIGKHMFIHEAITFDLNKAELSPKAKAVLKHKIKWLAEHPGIDVVVEGHCDNLGSDKYNAALGEKRAMAVRDFMIDNGVKESRILLTSSGKSSPVSSGRTEEELAKNRRVSFNIVE